MLTLFSSFPLNVDLIFILSSECWPYFHPFLWMLTLFSSFPLNVDLIFFLFFRMLSSSSLWLTALLFFLSSECWPYFLPFLWMLTLFSSFPLNVDLIFILSSECWPYFHPFLWMLTLFSSFPLNADLIFLLFFRMLSSSSLWLTVTLFFLSSKCWVILLCPWLLSLSLSPTAEPQNVLDSEKTTVILGFSHSGL